MEAHAQSPASDGVEDAAVAVGAVDIGIAAGQHAGWDPSLLLPPVQCADDACFRGTDLKH